MTVQLVVSLRRAYREARRDFPSRSSPSRGFLFQPIRLWTASYLRRRRDIGEGRAFGAVLALAAEALLMLLVLTLGSNITSRGDQPEATVVRFKAAPESESQAEEQQDDAREDTVRDISKEARTMPRPADPTQVTPPDVTPAKPQPAPQLIQLSPREMAAWDIAARPKSSAPVSGAKFGPVDTGPRVSDSQRVSGSGPNGEPLYAASWYREPYPDELSGYLQTASGPGWGLIACRTAPDYRVEDCVKIDEYPNGSNIARSVLAAAWQFRVRPPRIGGQPKIGEWVRIRIDYDFRPKR